LQLAIIPPSLSPSLHSLHWNKQIVRQHNHHESREEYEQLWNKKDMN